MDNGVNRQYKDRLFQRLFSDPGHKENLLSLFNALNETDYTDPDDLEITTIEDIVYMKMKNDVSCIIDDRLMLVEHQSSYNPNMPLRGLLYFGRLYDQLISLRGMNLYGRKQRKIPTPGYFVLYNGDEDQPDRKILKLSDAFAHPVQEGYFEWTAVMININEGHNPKLLSACKMLEDYSCFVVRVKQGIKMGKSLLIAVTEAVDSCIRDGILADYLKKNKAEVIGMLLTEYDEAATMEAIRQDSYEDGWDEGREEGLEEGLERGLERGITILIENMRKNNLPEEMIRAVLDCKPQASAIQEESSQYVLRNS